MSKRSAQRTRPFVWLFRLGAGTKVGKTSLPSAHAEAPCYCYRSDHEEFASVLSALAEPAVSGADFRRVYRAIQEFARQGELALDLYNDAEIEAGGSYSQTMGFHAGVTFEKARAALEQGGFDVLTPTRRGSTPVALEFLEALEMHLELTSLELLLSSLTFSSSELPRHASAARDVLSRGLGRPAFARRALALASSSRPEIVDALVLLVALMARRATGKKLATLREFSAKLPAATDRRVREFVAPVPGLDQLFCALEADPPKGKCAGAKSLAKLAAWPQIPPSLRALWRWSDGCKNLFLRAHAMPYPGDDFYSVDMAAARLLPARGKKSGQRAHLIPFAGERHGGDSLVLDTRTGRVHYWDHETGDVDDNPVAISLEDLLAQSLTLRRRRRQVRRPAASRRAGEPPSPATS